MKIKLTSTRGFPLVMMVIAFLISAVAAAQEFIAKEIYDNVFENPNRDYVLLENNGSFFDIYGFSAFMFVFTFFAMILYAAGAGKPSVGAKTGILTMFAGLSAMVVPVLNFAVKLDSGIFDLTGFSDGDIFRRANLMITYLAPGLAAFLVFLAGLGLAIKAGGSKAVVFTAQTAQPVTVAQPAKAEPEIKVIPAESAVPASAPVTPVIQASDEAVIQSPQPEVNPQPEVKPASEAQTSADFCPACGTEIRPGTKFCRNCGAKINQ